VSDASVYVTCNRSRAISKQLQVNVAKEKARKAVTAEEKKELIK
jgi:hypothetical protein